MELPTWVVDDVLAPAKPIAFRLVVMLYRHGRQTVDGDGNRRVYWRGSTQQLARLIGASKRALLEAEAELSALGFLTQHNSTRPNAPHAISAPFERPSGDNLSPPSEPETAHIGDPLISPSTREEFGIHHQSPTARETICHRLEELGVAPAAAAKWVSKYRPARCEAAADATYDKLGGLRNPAGYLHHLLTSGQPLSPRASAYPASNFEERRRRFQTDGLTQAHERYYARERQDPGPDEECRYPDAVARPSGRGLRTVPRTAPHEPHTGGAGNGDHVSISRCIARRALSFAGAS